jgi:anti-anti-sigma factor
MDIRTEVRPSGVTEVFVEGALDMAVAPVLRDELQSLVKGGAVNLVINIAKVETIDSTALGALISGLKAARKNGGDLRITSPRERVSSLLKLTNLDQVLKIVDDGEFP